MIKLVVFLMLIALVLGGVAPKPPASHNDKKDESPSVKGVPLHPDQHPIIEHHKPSEVKHEAKHAEPKHEPRHTEAAHKADQKTVKKDEHHQHEAVKKADDKSHHDVAATVAHGKVLHPEHQPVHSSKDQHAQQEKEVKPKGH